MEIAEPWPEHAKLRGVREQSQAIGNFLEHSPYVLAEWVPCAKYHDDGGTCRAGSHLVDTTRSIEQILATFFEIDLDKIEAEKRSMLDAFRG